MKWLYSARVRQWIELQIGLSYTCRRDHGLTVDISRDGITLDI